MNAQFIYLLVFILGVVMAIWMQKRFCILCDASNIDPKPFSYARLQLLWWTFIILVSFISILAATGKMPTFDTSTLLLLGIGALTTASARIVDVADDNKYKEAVTDTNEEDVNALQKNSKDMKSEGFWLDILSDKTGISIPRFQAVVFNLFFGIWFIWRTVINLQAAGFASSDEIIDKIMPIIPINNLILLGISAGTYVALKSSENK
ncbi:hypothetical protein [Chitinophaga sancti]|uniref:hypothetical protein n=1 Tax=Chitinophaga sancti TaxID=1004 RepID=UPI003F797B80